MQLLSPSGAAQPGEECLWDGCGAEAETRQHCATHYEYLRRRGAFVGIPVEKPSVEERYLAKILPPNDDGCKLWSASRNEDGYGIFRHNGRMHTAHRWAYAHFVVTVPRGIVVRHNCDVRACQTIDHLLLGTQADNVQDMISRNRIPSRAGAAGHRAILTEDQVRFIRVSPLSNVELARSYNVSQSTISAVRTGQTWSSLK